VSQLPKIALWGRWDGTGPYGAEDVPREADDLAGTDLRQLGGGDGSSDRIAVHPDARQAPQPSREDGGPAPAEGVEDPPARLRVRQGVEGERQGEHRVVGAQAVYPQQRRGQLGKAIQASRGLPTLSGNADDGCRHVRSSLTPTDCSLGPATNQPVFRTKISAAPRFGKALLQERRAALADG